MSQRTVMLFRPQMMDDIDRMDRVWTGAQMIWSFWDGYRADATIRRFQEALARRNLTLETIHTSGHASVGDLKRLVDVLGPDVLVPVHTTEGACYAALFGGSVTQRADGEWWEV